ncbi:MAG: PEGA domain-containing protein, partial [Myxococcota bacterium]|nr:PEGA domain-containing protein [Myxococcota bacterium]
MRALGIARVAWLGIGLALASAPAATCLWAMPSRASAQEDASSRARARFEEGIALADRGAYEEAIERFRQSIALVERPSTVFNLGVALRELRRDAEAIAAFERFLEIADASIDDAPIAQARGWIAATQRAMQQRGGTLVLEYEPRGATVRIDGMDVGSSSPLVLDLAPGTHRVELEAAGREPASLEVALAPGERVARRVE